MKKTRLSTALAAVALVGASFGQDLPAPSPAAAPQGDESQVAAPQGVVTNAEGFAAARAKLAELMSLPGKTTLLCGTSLQFPYYHFALVPSSSPREIGEMWSTSFGLLATYAQGNAELAAEMFAAGADFLARVEDDDARQELMRLFQSFGEQAIELTSQDICKSQPSQVVPYLKQLIATKSVTARFGDKLVTLPPSPLASVRPEFIGALVRNMQPALMGDGTDAQNIRAFEATVIDFLSEDGISADVRDALIDALLAPSFERAQTAAAAVRQLLADAGRLRAKLAAEDAQTVINQRLQAFGERMIDQTSQKLCGEDPANAVAYLRKIASTRAFCARFGEKEMAEFSKTDFPPPSDEFILRLIASTYPRIAESAVSTENMRALNALVVKTLIDEDPEKVPGNLLNAFLDGSVKRAQDDAESAHMLFADADKLIAGLKDANSQVAVERRCRQFARKSAVKTFRDICPGRPNDVIPYLKKLADTGALCALYGNSFVSFKPGRTTAVSPDLVGQLAEEAIIGFSNGTDTKMLNNILDFTATLLPKLSDDAKQTMLDRRLDAFFLVGNYDGAIDLLEKGLPSHSPGWCRGTAAKLRYHKALNEGKKAEAIKQLLVFIEFMQSDEQKDFEDCDPTTGIIYSREWVIAKNFMRCAEIARDLKDAANEAKYLAEAKKLYATALEKAKDDPKALVEVKKEAKAVGL